MSIKERLSGRILLQVEERGEAWYLSPMDKTRYFLGRPDDAFSIMRAQGIGISNENLKKIPIAVMPGHEQDLDQDGLSDKMEEAIGTFVDKKDSDGDGYSDYEELVSGFNYLGEGKNQFDDKFVNKHKGKIFLQIEGRGEAWYVDPVSKKRFFLGRPKDAFMVMRSLGLGISNKDLESINLEDLMLGASKLEVKIHELINEERVKNGLGELKYNEELSVVARRHSNDLMEENKRFTSIDVACDNPLIHHEGFSFGAYNIDRLNNSGIHFFEMTGENIALNPNSTFVLVHSSESQIDEEIGSCASKRQKEMEEFKKSLHNLSDTGSKLELVKKAIKEREEEYREMEHYRVVSKENSSIDDIARRVVDGWMNSPGHRQNILTSGYDEAGMGVVEGDSFVISTQVFIKRAKCGYLNGPCCREGEYVACFNPYSCNDMKCN